MTGLRLRRVAEVAGYLQEEGKSRGTKEMRMAPDDNSG